MNPGLLAALGAITVLVLAVLVWSLVDRARLRGQVHRSEADLRALNERMDELAEEAERARMAAAAAPVAPQAEYLITSVGEPVPDRVVLSAAVGEPLVKAVAFGYGVRRALRPETRNRIAFEMKREIKRARKQRRREAKAAVREARRREAAA